MTESDPDDDLDATQPEAPSVDPDHHEDGLDLARAIARSTAGGNLPAARRPRKPRGVRPTGQLSGAHPDDRDPQLLESTMARIIADRGWAPDLRVHGVFARWVQLVGAEIGAHSTPESFTEGRLVVRTDSTAWATQLKLLLPRLQERLDDELGAGVVTTIEVLGPQAPSWKKGPRGLRDGRGPRDTYG